MTGFDQFELPAPLLRGIKAAGFEDPWPIQLETIPAGLQGRDVLGLAQMSGDDELRPVCEKVIAALPAAADDVRAGKEKAMSALIGGVMRETRGAADHAEATRILRELIGV